MAKKEKKNSGAVKKAAFVEAPKPKKQSESVLKQKETKGIKYDPAKSYIVRPGCALTSQRGILGGGHPVKAKFFRGGAETLKVLVEEKGTVVEVEAPVEAPGKP